MFRTDHLAGPIAIGRYRSPAGRNADGRTIEPGREEIEFFLDGEGYYEWQEQLHTIRCGAVLWHLPGEMTIYRNHPTFPYVCLVLTFPTRGLPVRQVPKITQWEQEEARDFAAELITQYHRDEVDRVLLGQYVYTRMVWQAYSASLRQPTTELPRSVQLAMHLLDTQFARPMHIAGIAEQVDVSKAHLHALFKRHLGLSPYQYLLQRRLQESRRLLAFTDQLVKEVSYTCGFHDVVNFCRCFKARFHIAPAEYRARNTIKR